MSVTRRVACGECGISLESAAATNCPGCGSTSVIVDIVASDDTSIRVLDAVRLKQRDSSLSSKKNPIREVRAGLRQDHSGRVVQEHRVIDKRNNTYSEHIVDAATGETIHQCEERLSDHQGHGHAKKKDA